MNGTDPIGSARSARREASTVFRSVAVQDHGLKPRHDIGKQRPGTVPTRVVRVPDRDEPGNPFGLRVAGPVKHWSPTSSKEKLTKIGAKVVSHGRYVAFQMAEAAISRYLFAGILRLIEELRPPPAAVST